MRLATALPTGPPSVNFEGPHAIFRAIGPRARLILIPDHQVKQTQSNRMKQSAIANKQNDMVEHIRKMLR